MKKFTSPFLLIRKSLDIFTKKENFISFVRVYLPIGFLSLLSLVFLYVPFLSNFFNSSPGSILMMIFNLIFILVAVFVNLAGIVSVSKVLSGEKINIKTVYKKAFTKYWKFLLLGFVMFLIYFFGFLILIIPFILFVTWFTFSKFIMVEKGFGIKASMSESRKIVKGNFWKVLIRILVFGLFYIIVNIAITVLPYGIGTVIFSLLGALFIMPTYLLYKEISS